MIYGKQKRKRKLKEKKMGWGNVLCTFSIQELILISGTKKKIRISLQKNLKSNPCLNLNRKIRTEENQKRTEESQLI